MAKSMLATETFPSQPNGKLVEVETPIVTNEHQMQESLDKALQQASSDERIKETPSKSVVTGLGVDGVDGMKSVNI